MMGKKNGSATGKPIRTFDIEFVASNQHGNSLVFFDGRTITIKRNPVKLKENRAKGQIPYGWRLNIFGQLVEHDAEQRMIRRIKELRAEGKSLRDIAAYLNDFDIPTKNGGHWQANTVRKVVRNYSGRLSEESASL